MSKMPAFALLIALLPALVPGKSPPDGCALAYRLQQAELPQDIAVKTDRMTSDATKIAMDWWVARLSSPARPITWHTVEDSATCMIYIRFGWEEIGERSVLGHTYMPVSKRYHGLAIVKLVNPWIVAHEIGHVIGCAHGIGIMRAEYSPFDNRLWIDDYALRLASLVRLRASLIALPPASQTIADATLPD
jgi:hypothetical protein